MHLPDVFVAQGERGIILGENSLRQFEHALPDSHGLGQTAPGAQGLQVILQDAPKSLLAFHIYQPSLNRLTRVVANCSAASGKA